MSKRTWPHWPEDQLPLFTIDDTPSDQRNSDASVTRGGRIKDKIPVGRVICQTCGFPKTLGLPCPTCARINAGGQGGLKHTEFSENTPQTDTFSIPMDTE